MATKKELVAQAEAAGVEGAAKMSKVELEQALAEPAPVVEEPSASYNPQARRHANL